MIPDFVNALLRRDLEAVRKVPKTDLHNHATFGARIEHVERWASTPLRRPPSSMRGFNELSRNRTTLNVCPTSNVTLGAVESLVAHPIRKLYDHGVWVTINTDDLMIFSQSVSEEYLNLYRAGVFSAEELDGIRETALRSVLTSSS